MLFLAYLGPDTMLPMTSVLAAAAGFVMMFGRKAVDIVMLPFRRKANGAAGTTPAPAARASTRARGHRPTASRPMASLPTATAAPFEADEPQA